MKNKRTILLLSVLSLAILVAGCDCGGGPNLQGAAPWVGNYFVGPTNSAPGLDGYTAMPDSGEVDIDFGMVDTDTTANRYVFLHNAGKGTLNLVKVEATTGSSADYFLACLVNGVFVVNCNNPSDQNPLATAGLSDLVIQVSFAPNAVGKADATFLLTTNSTKPTSVFTLKLTGEGVTPQIEVCVTDCTGDQGSAACGAGQELCTSDSGTNALTVPFGDANIGDHVRRHVVIRNKGNRPLQVSSLRYTSGDFNQFDLDLGGNLLPGTVAVGAQATIFVIYAPGLGGEHHSLFSIVSNDVNQREVRVAVSGRSLAPRLCPDPLILDFGNLNTGASLVKNFTITNCGLKDLNLSRVELSPPAGSRQYFSITSKPALPALIVAGANVQVSVQYQPMASGTDTGGVDLYSDDPTSDPTTHFTGTVGLKGASIPRACKLQPTPWTVDFGSVVLNQPEVVTVVITNQGTDTCTLNSVAITQNSPNNEFSIVQTPAPNTTIAPGDAVSPPLKVQYLPTVLGMASGVLSLYGNDQSGPEVKVNLNGEGVQSASCTLQVAPTSLRFGTVKLNNTQAMNVTLTNVGAATCSITKLSIAKNLFGLPGDFSITAAPALPITLNKRGQPNSQATVEVTFAPQATGQQAAALRLTSNDPALQLNATNMACAFPPVNLGDACMPITGLSAESSIEVVPSELDFGVVTVGCNSPEMHVTVYNIGNSSINITNIYLENTPPPDPNFEIRSAPAVPHALAAGGSFQVVLRYHPQDANAHRSTLYIESDASNVQTLAVPLFGHGTTISDQTDIFHQPSQVKSDVLFVVDNSGSMQDDQQNLASNFGSFINWADQLQVDYHIGVIGVEVEQTDTSDVNSSMQIIPGVLVYIPNVTPKIITNQTPNIASTFSKNANLGTCCADNRESGLEAAWMALSQPLVDDPAKNGGFLREDAKLYIICMSDEQDQSRGTTDFYVDFFQSIKGPRNKDMMKVSAIVAPANDTTCGAQDGGGTRYIEVANRTGGIFESICGNWASTLQALGIDAFSAIRDFPLSRPADPNTITVTVNGVTVPQASSQGGANGWTYYSDDNSIYFGDNVVPNRGDTIEVHYTAICL